MIRLVMQAITHCQLYAHFLTNLYHFFTIFHGICHGFLYNNVLSSPCGSDYELFVHGIGQNYINQINGFIIDNFIEILIIINIFSGNIVSFRPDFRLTWCTCNDTRQMTILGILETFCQISSIASQATKGNIKLFCFIIF